jgi:hypothetical protein
VTLAESRGLLPDALPHSEARVQLVARGACGRALLARGYRAGAERLIELAAAEATGFEDLPVLLRIENELTPAFTPLPAVRGEGKNATRPEW